MKNIGLQNLLERPPATPFDDEVFPAACRNTSARPDTPKPTCRQKNSPRSLWTPSLDFRTRNSLTRSEQRTACHLCRAPARGAFRRSLGGGELSNSHDLLDRLGLVTGNGLHSPGTVQPNSCNSGSARSSGIRLTEQKRPLFLKRVFIFCQPPRQSP
jgi:hypothetical protein